MAPRANSYTLKTTMMKLLYFVMLCSALLLCKNGDAQQIIANSGTTLQNSNESISFTLGELVIDTYNASTKTLTEGFHQPQITITAINELSGLDFTVMAFPNPTSDIVELKVEKVNSKDIEYFLLDINGKLLARKKIESSETEIPFSQLAPAIYILKLQVDGKEAKIFKIVKQ
jgi:hypothetical protein